MLSERKQQANRKNARASTGPRTAAGKARSARNAYRHGLSVPIDAAQVPELDQSADLLVGKDADPQLRQSALAVAAAQLDLVRVRQAERQLLARAGGVSADAKELSQVIDQLTVLDRYERRARSRRKSAIRAFDLLRTSITTDEKAPKA